MSHFELIRYLFISLYELLLVYELTKSWYTKNSVSKMYLMGLIHIIDRFRIVNKPTSTSLQLIHNRHALSRLIAVVNVSVSIMDESYILV